MANATVVAQTAAGGAEIAVVHVPQRVARHAVNVVVAYVVVVRVGPDVLGPVLTHVEQDARQNRLL